MKTDYLLHERGYRQRKEQGAEGWDDRPEGLEEHKKELEFALSSDLFKPKSRVLELGCGAGEISIWFAEQGHHVTGIDIAPTAIEWAKERAEGKGLPVTFQVGDVCSLEEFGGNEFDAVIDGHCLHCIIGEDRAKFLNSAYRVLKPNRLLHIAHMVGDLVVEESEIKRFDPETRIYYVRDLAYRYVPEPQNLLDEIRRTGFEIVESRLDGVESNEEQDTLLVNARK